MPADGPIDFPTMEAFFIALMAAVMLLTGYLAVLGVRALSTLSTLSKADSS